MFCQKMFLKTLQNSQKNMWEKILQNSQNKKLRAGNRKLSEAATGDVQ